jgi:hypothetical protein
VGGEGGVEFSGRSEGVMFGEREGEVSCPSWQPPYHSLPVQDLPSFVQNVRQFTSDLRYFVILNSSVPSGSVKLT